MEKNTQPEGLQPCFSGYLCTRAYKMIAGFLQAVTVRTGTLKTTRKVRRLSATSLACIQTQLEWLQLLFLKALCAVMEQQRPPLVTAERKKAYSTWYSQAVSHPSTNQARPCLASEIRRDRACSGWYGRKRWNRLQKAHLKLRQGPLYPSVSLKEVNIEFFTHSIHCRHNTRHI